LLTEKTVEGDYDMNFAIILDSPVFTWVILPLLIFAAKILDVSLGTVRIILVSRGNKFLAPLLGFFEVLIWLLAISQIMQHLDNLFCYIAYAGGFAAGNYIGMRIEERLALGILVVRIFAVKDECELKNRLVGAGYGVTIVDAEGANGKVKVIYTIIKRKNVRDVVSIIERCNSKTFYSIEDARTAYQGIFPTNNKGARSFAKTRKLFGTHLNRK